MKSLAFASRNGKEIIRDKINLFFGIGFPVILLVLLSFIQSNLPVDMFQIDILAPGIVIFGLAFISLFSAVLISKDRSESLILRLFTSPLISTDYILGYTVPMLPIALAQVTICYIVSFFLGLKVNANVLMAILVTVPAAVLFISIGLLCGSLLNDKQVGGVCGALLTNLTAWLSGIWFDPALVGGWFKKLSDIMPFVHAVNAGRAAIAGEYSKILPELGIVAGYALVVTVLAVFAFKKKMNSDDI